MVGVGGRSKACGHCRRRRIKCDEAKPQCKRCQKAKLKCEGYSGISIIQYERKDRARPQGASGEMALSVSSPKSLQAVNHIQSEELFGSPWLSVLQDDIFISYTLTRLLGSPDQEAVNVTGAGRSLTEVCFLALSTTYFGVEHGERSVVQRGLQQYSHALKLLNQALGNASRHSASDVLDAVTVVTLYEFIVSEDSHAWIRHACGLQSLLEMYGPDSFSSPSGLSTLERARLPIISAALLLHRPTVFAKPEWKLLPWSRYPDRKNLLQNLLDILADCPGLFIEKDGIDTGLSGQEANAGYQLLSEKARGLIEELAQWEKVWTAHHPECYHERLSPATTPTSSALHGQVLPIWSTVLEYQSLYHAKAMTLYNTTRILLLKYTQEVSLPKRELAGEEQVFSRDIFAAGMKICRSMDYYLDHIQKGTGDFFLLFPLRMAFDAVGPCNWEIRAWLKNVLHLVSSGPVSRWAAAKSILDWKTRGNRQRAYGV